MTHESRSLLRAERPPGRGRPGARRSPTTRCSSRSRRAASAAPTSSTTTARARSARPTGRGRSCSGTSSPAEDRRPRQARRQLRSGRGRPGRGQPDPELQRVHVVPGRQAAVLREPVRSRRDDRTAASRTFAKTKAAHAYKLPDSLTDEQGAFVEMLSAAVNAVRKADVAAGRLRRRLRPGPGRTLDGAAAQERGRARRRRRHAGLPARAGEGARRRLRVQGGDGRSPSRYRARTTAALADKAIVATGSMDANQEALEVTGPRLDRRLHGRDRARRGGLGADADQPDPGQDDQVLALVPVPVADDDPHAVGREGRHRARSSRTRAGLDGIGAAIERVVNRDDEVIKTLITP